MTDTDALHENLETGQHNNLNLLERLAQWAQEAADMGYSVHEETLRAAHAAIREQEAEIEDCMSSLRKEWALVDALREQLAAVRADRKDLADRRGEFVMELTNMRAELERTKQWINDHETLFAADALREQLAAARKYVRRIEEIMSAPVEILSVGPGRDETLWIGRGKR